MSGRLKLALVSAVERLPTPVVARVRRRYRNISATLGLIAAAWQDARWYLKWSGLIERKHHGRQEACLYKDFHRVEKGLALPAPRLGFGKDAIESVLEMCDALLKQRPPSPAVAGAIDALNEYAQFNEGYGVDVKALRTSLTEMQQALQACEPSTEGSSRRGGTMFVTRDAIHSAAKRDLREFFASRHSVRQFASGPVSRELLAEAVAIAQCSPSVCNRQGGHVFVVENPGRMRDLMAFQNGNRGFGDQAGVLLILAVRMDCFLTVGERYQCWIDGGLFAMSLIYALHSLGLGSCCLNWSVEPDRDAAFKRAAGISDGHAITMLLAVGHLPEGFRVAASPRRPISEVIAYL